MKIRRPGYVIRTESRHSGIGLTARKRSELTLLAERWQSARARYVVDYWSPRYAAAVMRSPRKLVEERRKRGWLEGRLMANHNKVCLESALAVVRADWMSTIARARALTNANQHLSESEKRWLRYVLRWPELLQKCLDDESVKVPQEWASSLSEHRLSKKLRHLLLNTRGSRPRLARGHWFLVDSNLYRAFLRTEDRYYKGAWLGIAGLSRYRRVNVPLAGASIDEFALRTACPNSRPTVRIEITGERVVFHVPIRVETKRPSGALEAGIDKGYRTLLTVSTGEPNSALTYGMNASCTIEKLADLLQERSRQRRRFQAYERSLRNSERQKAQRIRKRNLGRTRESRLIRRSRSTLQSEVNRALNEMFKVMPSLSRLHVEALDFAGERLSKATNRRLRWWLRGYLHSRLRQKAELNGVELNVVNAAYTSQTCPRCWFTSARNRSGDRFQCGACAYTGSSDAVAATNILRRGSDPAIARSTRPDRVKHILEGRWRPARIGRAWGSNERMLDSATWESETDPDRAANNS